MQKDVRGTLFVFRIHTLLHAYQVWIYGFIVNELKISKVLIINISSWLSALRRIWVHIRVQLVGFIVEIEFAAMFKFQICM